MTFEFATAGRMVFGPGCRRELMGLVRALGSSLCLLTGRAPRGAEGLEAKVRLVVHGEPTFDSVREATAAARAEACDVVVAIGGGSVMDAGKAVAMLLANGGDPLDYAEVIGSGRPVSQPSVPFVAVPTTAGTGSEVTRNAVLSAPAQRVKVSLRSPLMLPRVALVDPELSLGLPRALTASTGMDALAQLIEPFVSCRANPMTDAVCREGLPRVARALPRVVADGGDLEARSDMALGALWSGLALANAGLGAVHGFAAALGGAFDAPHGAVCAALLPGVVDLNARVVAAAGDRAVCDRFDELARMLTGLDSATAPDAVRWLFELKRELSIPPLRAYGLTVGQVDEVVAKTLQTSSLKGNPVPLPSEALKDVLLAAL